tara:strand:- start:459 stop:899 length:441 start_codon:yes stop_codon:yes gene_type:complete
MVLDEIKEQLKASMKKGDKKNVLAIRNILEKIKNVQVDSKEELKENQIIKIIAKHAKQLRESIVQFKNGNRLDLAEKEQEELKIAEQFLPAQLNENEIKDIVINVIKDLNATQMSDMGKVMKAVIDQTKGNADGKLISTLVRESLI